MFFKCNKPSNWNGWKAFVVFQISYLIKKQYQKLNTKNLISRAISVEQPLHTIAQKQIGLILIQRRFWHYVINVRAAFTYFLPH